MKTILFVCIHNAGRSQMAEALMSRRARERGIPVEAVSAGTTPDDQILWQAQMVMAELGIPTMSLRPKLLTQAMADAADYVITLGCGLDANASPVRLSTLEDWPIADPRDKSRDEVRVIRDQIKTHVETLLDRLEQEAKPSK